MLEYCNSGSENGRQSGGTRFVASGHDEAWPSRTDIPHHSNIPIFQYSSWSYRHARSPLQLQTSHVFTIFSSVKSASFVGEYSCAK